MRREIYGALVGFAVGSVVVLAALAWMIARFVTPELRWWEVVHTSINAIMISIVLGGLEPVINFLEEKDVQSKYNPALHLGCRRNQSLIRVMSAMKSGIFAFPT